MKYFLLFLGVFMSWILSAQTLTFGFKGTVSNFESGKNESGVTVQIIQDGKPVGSATTSSNGKYQVKGPVNYKKPFKVQFTKAGMATKFVNFDFKEINEEDTPAGSEFYPVSDFSMTMITSKPEVDLSFLNNEPVGAFYWNYSSNRAESDNALRDRMKNKVEKLINDAQKNNAENDAKYQALIVEADNLYNAQKWEEALLKYEAALSIKPTEKHPSDRINELDALILAKKKEDLANQQADYEYNNLIKAADALRDQKKYEPAIVKYEEALLKKDEDYPRTQISELKKLVEQQKSQAEIDAKYNEAVKMADMFYNQKSYLSAKDKYIIANNLKPQEQHPIIRLAEIEKKQNELNEANEKKKKYEDAVAAADAFFGQEQYEDAKAKYLEALTYESGATYPTLRIKDCDKKIAELLAQKQKQEKIDKLLQEGATFFDQAKWVDSRGKYNEVLILDPGNLVAKDRLSEIDVKIKEAGDLAAQEAKFNKLVGEGDVAVKGLKWQDAKSKYEEALGIKEDSAVRGKLDGVLAKIKEEEEKANLEAKFQELKTQGLQLAIEQKWFEAKDVLTQAKDIKADPVVIQKLKEVEEKIKSNEALLKLEEEYNSLIAEAQSKEGSKNYDGAIAKYKEASLKKPAEKMPKDKIIELELLKKDLAKQAEIDAKYDAFMKKGNELMALQKYLDAIKEFNSALAIKPEEQEPADKAAECERLEREKGNEEDQKIEKILTVALQKFDEKDYPKSRELAERFLSFKPNDTRGRDLLAKINDMETRTKAYQAKMAEGKKLKSEKIYQKAIASFEQALVIFPEEKEPKDLIDELRALMDSQTSEAEKEALYKDFMNKGGISEAAKSWDQALVHYQNALNVRPESQAAKDKVAEMQQILDDLANASKSEQEKQDKFNKLIQEADSYFSSEEYLDAKVKYDAALALYPNNSYAKNQSIQCERRERDKSLAEAERSYRKIVDKADEYFNAEDYEKAREYYERALSVRAVDPYPQKKIDEIEAILNPRDFGAVEMKPLGDPFPENSIMDGYALLVQADIERKNVKNEAVVNTVDGALANENMMRDLKVIQQEETTNEIRRVVEGISVSNEESDDNRRAIVKALRDADLEYEMIAITDNQYKTSDLRRAQDKLDIVEAEGDIDYTQRTNVYVENHDLLDSYSGALRVEMQERSEKYIDRNIDSDVKLDLVQNRVEEDNIEGYERQRRNDQLVEDVEKNAENTYNTISDEKEKALTSKNSLIVLENLKVDERAVSDSKHAPGNKEELKTVETVVIEAEKVKSEYADLRTEGNASQMIVINSELDQDFSDRDNGRKENVEKYKENEFVLNEGKREKLEQENIKYLANKNIIDEEDKKQVVIKEQADEKLAQNATMVEIINVGANSSYEEKGMSDDEQRMATRSGVENISSSTDEFLENSTDKQKENALKVEDLNKAMEAGTINQESAKKEQLLDARQKIENIDGSKPAKKRIANALGQEYPEGVSQESFTQSDENGLMTAIITRRIVVINGEGNVYVRTQTLHNITYTKNDQPTTEYTWQKETTGPHLQKHY